MTSPCPTPGLGLSARSSNTSESPRTPGLKTFALPASIHVSKPHLVVVNLPVSLGLMSNFFPFLLFKCFVQVQHTDIYSSITFH